MHVGTPLADKKNLFISALYAYRKQKSEWDNPKRALSSVKQVETLMGAYHSLCQALDIALSEARSTERNVFKAWGIVERDWIWGEFSLIHKSFY